MSEEDFQEFLAVLQVEQVMGMRMLRYRDIPLIADLRYLDEKGQATQEFVLNLIGQPHEGCVDVFIPGNDNNDEPLLLRGREYRLTYVQAEEIAALFGSRARLSQQLIDEVYLVKGVENVDAWLSAFTTLITAAKPKARHNELSDMLRTMHRVLEAKKAIGELRTLEPNDFWQMIRDHMNLDLRPRW